MSGFDLHPTPWSVEYLDDEQMFVVRDATDNDLMELFLDDFPQWDFTPVEIMNLIVKSVNTANNAEAIKVAFRLACAHIAEKDESHPDIVADELLMRARISLNKSEKG